MTILTRLQARDPDLLNLRKAARAVLVCVPLFAVLKLWLHLDSVATFSFFASFVGLVFADYGGPPRPRAAAYLAMIVIGNLVVIVGSLLSGSIVGGAAAMFVVMFAATFATVFGGYTPAFIAPVALAYSLTVLDPLASAPLDARVLGWTIGGGAALVAALVLWPVDRRLALRQTLAAVSTGLAEALESVGDKQAAEAAFKRTADLLAEARRKASAPFRPAGPLSHDIGLLHLVEHLEQATDMARQVQANGLATPDDAALVVACATAFRETAAALLGANDPTAAERSVVSIEQALRADRRMTDLSAIKATESPRGHDEGAAEALTLLRRSCAVFALSHIAIWVDAAVAAALGVRDLVPGGDPMVESMSDRPIDLLGRIGRTIERGFAFDGVIFRNSVRSAAAMTLAVVLAKVLPVEHGFWITLGALLVLRSNAGTTSATALQAIVGTLIGFVVAAVLLTLIGHSTTALWTVLPLTIFLAGYTPGAVGFVVGQASFTTALVVLFTLISPAGIATAVDRVETVSLGAVSAAVIGLALWPRGARAALAAAVAAVYRATAAGMRTVVTGPQEHCRLAAVEIVNARRRADEAFGVALTERGRRLDTRVWLDLFLAPNLVHSMVSGLVPPPAPWLSDHCGAALAATARHRDRVADALDAVADRIDPAHASSAAKASPQPIADSSPFFVDCLERARASGADDVDRVRNLVAWDWSLSFIEQDIASTRPDLDVVVAVSKPQAWLRWSAPGKAQTPKPS